MDHGEKVLKVLSKEPDINLVLLDFKLPGINGLELTAIIKKGYPNIQIIMITAYEDEKIKIEAFNLGVSGYITKPFALVEFLKVIENALTYVSKPL